MSLVKPFRAWHYDSNVVSIDRVIAPPYDIISDEENRLLHERDPRNVIRLILGQPKPGEILPDSIYQGAGRFLDDWTEKKIIVSDLKESFYLYETRYKHPLLDRMFTRLAVFGLLKLEPFENRLVFRHEQTHASPKADRAKLIRATKANFSPAFILYEDQSAALDQMYAASKERAPLFHFEDWTQATHRVWAFDRDEEKKLLASAFDRRRFFIADGHHRY